MHTLALIILVLGIVNFSRMTILTVLTLIYEFILRKRRIKRQKSLQATQVTYKFTPLVSIVIAAYNEEKVIRRTIESLFQSTYKRIQVIVVNDGSKDKTEEEIYAFMKENPDKQVTYVYQKNQGKAHALNNGIQNYVKGPLYMCLDADSVLAEDAIEHAVPYFRNPKIKALAANVKIIPDNSIMGIIQQIEYIVGYHLKKALTVGNMEYIIGGVGSMFRTETVKKVGYYDTDTITEDIDLTMKIIGLGNKQNMIAYAEDVVAYTEAPRTPYALFRQRFRWKYGRFQTFWKNRYLFFNADPKYSRFLTFVYLPFQLYSELVYLFDPFFILYIAYLSFLYLSFSSYLQIFVFLMFFTVIAIATDRESPTTTRLKLLLLSPLAYAMFFTVSIIEYSGLIKSLIRWKGIVYAKKENNCGWTHVERIGGKAQAVT